MTKIDSNLDCDRNRTRPLPANMTHRSAADGLAVIVLPPRRCRIDFFLQERQRQTSRRDSNLPSSAIFTARCTIVQSAVLRLHVVRLSVCPSVCLSDVGGSGPHRSEILETNSTRTIIPTLSFFLAQRPSTYSRRNIRKFLETRGKTVAYL